ncbi:SRPBCC family protein [Paenibacillus arenilitoris]|uniref:SRPBCC domain-containing protein n=1 Tax=Paenibacillus arenilitoris TaxID=2772299 RepID=A0A927CNG6_9BACL|nr:SRPBCC domain-containing protein [Paenibacillus arenilitoris]MBD2871303.1 SRPBCC domain-containing protein [Paenibacillus arenilitoris]
MNEENRYAYVTARVTRQFNASPEQVFDAWLNPERMRGWLFTSATSDPAGRTVVNDARIGGKWSISDRRNGNDYSGDGEYVEIDRPRRLVFTFRMLQFSPTVDRVVIEIAPLESGCELTLTQEITVPRDDRMTPADIERMLEEYRRGTEHGWNEMFDLLAATILER